MQILFTLIARTVIEVRTVTVTSDGTNYFVKTDSGTRPVRTLRQAVHFAREEIGHFLAPIERAQGPWGLYVSVAGVAAFYGELQPNVPRSGGPPLPPGELINRIRDDYRPGDGPLAALRNAIRIIEAYLGRGHRAAA
jgi:hypothetical protein